MNNDYDDVTNFLGDWGPFQIRMGILLCISIIPSGFACFSIVFLAATPPHHCAIPPTANISAEWRNYSIPLEEDNGVMQYSKCTRYKLDVIKQLSDNGSVPGVDVNVTDIEQESCKDGWEYDRSVYASTLVTEWDLVCNEAWKVPMTSCVFFSGWFTGSFMSGQLSDRFGRKITLFVTMGVHTLFVIFQIFSTSWLMYTAFYFVVGMGEISNYLTVFVLGTEILTPSIRTIYCSVGASAFFALGYALLPLTTYFIRDWRMLLIAIAVPGVLYFFLWRFIPESPRWLISQGRVEEAEAILREAAKKNKVKAPEVIFQPLQVENKEELNHHSICDFVKSSNIRYITMIMSFTWMTVSMGYYALSLNTSNLVGNPFLNSFLSASVEIPAYTLSWPLLRSFPRRLCIFPMLIVCGTLLLFTQLIPTDLSPLSITLEMMGKFWVSVAFTLVYAFTAELYPTILRNTAVGICSTVSQLGTIAAPYILYLGTYYKSLPYLIMGSLIVLGGVLGFLLPETYGLPLPETIDHMQKIQRCKKRKTSNNFTRESTEMENVLML